MTHIEIIDDTFVVMQKKKVVGVVVRQGEWLWGFFPLVMGDLLGSKYVPLQDALAEALRFKPSF